MSKLLSLTALASAVVLATTFAITPAAAFGGHGGGGHMGGGHIGGGRMGGGHIGGAHMRGRYNFSKHFSGPQRRFSGHFSSLRHHPHHWRFSSSRGRWGHWRHGSRWGHWRHGSYRWGYAVPAAVGVAGVATYAAAAPASVCTCLTKQYLDNGAVVFTDTCTNESAIAMPPAPMK